MDLISFCRACLDVTEQPAIAMPLATIGWARTEGEAAAEGRRWTGAFGVSIELHGEAPIELADQIRHAAGILRSQESLHKLDSTGLVWTPQKPIEPITGPKGAPVPGSDRLLREVERCAAYSLAWDAPSDMAQAVAFAAGDSRPVTYEDLASAMAWRHDPQPHYDAAEEVIREGFGVWRPAAKAATSSDAADWTGAAAGGLIVAGLLWLAVRG